MADKSLGQHWLFDKKSLEVMADSADVIHGDTVLEIGPGLGTLTDVLLKRGARVIAVEFDARLIDDLKDKFNGQNFEVVQSDILQFNFSSLPKGYKIVANIPYYLTSNLLRVICESSNRPSKASLLVQKEVAERVAELPGNLSILAISVQLYATATVGDLVPAELFSPPPKVDSQVLKLHFFDQPLVTEVDRVMRLVKAGFSSPRKKLRSSLAGGLGVSIEEAEKMLEQANINPNRRAQTLFVKEWIELSQINT